MARQTKRNPWAIGGAVVLVLILAGVGIYAWSGQLGKDKQAEDAAGLTQLDVSGNSLQEEFRAYGKRYAHATQVLKKTQDSVRAEPWDVDSTGLTPEISSDPVLPGANSQNSYHLALRRAWQSDADEAAATRLQPMEQYFQEQGWDVSHHQAKPDTESEEGVKVVEARLENDWLVTYSAHPGGRNTLRVVSPHYWTKDAESLRKAIDHRRTDDDADRLRPDEIPAFPTW